MTAITILLYVMIFIISLLLIALILIQPSKSGGMGAAFGGVGESAFGGKAGSHLTKTTVVMTAIFFVFALLLAMFIFLMIPPRMVNPPSSIIAMITYILI